MARAPLLQLSDISLTFGGDPVFSGLSLVVQGGDRLALVGRNGSGKSTLMKVMAGLDKEYTGEAWPGEGITVGYLAQEPELDPTKTVKQNVMDGVRPVADLVERFDEISNLMADPPEDADFDALMVRALDRRNA